MKPKVLKPKFDNMYYNTTKELGHQRELFEQKAKNQTDEILNIFKRHYSPLTSYQIQKAYTDNLAHQPLITSVTRSLNTLEKQGLIEKTGNTMKGPYNRPNLLWELKSK